MKRTDKKRKYSNIITFLLITALLTQEGFLPFLQTGALDTQIILADDFSSEESAAVDEFSLPENSAQDQPEIGFIESTDDSWTDQSGSDAPETASAEWETGQAALTASDGESKLSVHDDTSAVYSEDVILSLRSLKDKEITGYLDRAKQVLNWEEPEFTFIRIYDPVIETVDGVQIGSDSPAIMEVRLWDETTMSDEQKEQFVRQNAVLLDAERQYASLDEQFLDVRSNYIRQMRLENLHVVRFGTKDEQPETSLEDGVIRFKTDKLYPFVLLMRAEDQVDSSSDFSVGEDPAENWTFEDPETEKILKGMKEETEDVEVKEELIKELALNSVEESEEQSAKITALESVEEESAAGQQENGGYQISYIPYFDTGSGVTFSSNTDSDWITVPESGRYTEQDTVTVAQKPANPTVVGGLMEDYAFQGWQLVKVQRTGTDENERPVFDAEPLQLADGKAVLYEPGDTLTVSGSYADSHGVLHMQAVYTTQTEDRPDETDLNQDVVRESMVYVTFVNDTGIDDITISLEAEGDTLDIFNLAGEEENAYVWQKMEDVSAIRIPKEGSVRLAIPNGAGRTITVKGKNTLGIGYLLTANAVIHGEPHKLEGALTKSDLDFTEVKNTLPFGLTSMLVQDAEGVTVTFKAEQNAHTLVLDDGYPGGKEQEIYLSESTAGVVYDGDESKTTYTLPDTGARRGYRLTGWSKEAPVYPLAENYTPDYAVTGTDTLTIQDLAAFFKSNAGLEKPDLPVKKLYAVWEIDTSIQTADITVKEILQSGNMDAEDFSFTASYTLNEKKYTIPFTLSSANTDGYVLEKIPVGVDLTITETVSDSYITSASSGKGVEDTDGEENVFTLQVTEDDTITFTNILKSYKVTFKSVDQNGRPVKGTYTISGVEGSLSSTETEAQFYANDNFYAGSYTLSQSDLAKGYYPLEDVTITVSGSGITCSDTENVTVTGNAGEGYVITVISAETKMITVQAVLSDDVLLENYQTYTFSYTAVFGSVTKKFTLAPSKNRPAVKNLEIPVGKELYVAQTDDARYDTEVSGGNPSGLSASLTVSEDSELIFTNRRKTVDITVTKAVLPDEGDEVYTFTAKVGNGEKPIGQYDIDKTDVEQKTDYDGIVSFEISRNGSKVLTIPSGAMLTITETNVPEGFQVSAEAVSQSGQKAGNRAGQSGTFRFVPTEDHTVTFTNAKLYTVTWVNEDDTVLKTAQSAYGTLPVYDGETPAKEATAQYTYTFAGWMPEIKEATGDVTYKAIYEKTLNQYTVTWKNDDDTVLETDEDVDYGTTPTYDGETPTKEQTVEKTFTFAGWTPEVSEVTGDVTYTALYKEEPRKYTITWKNYDQSVIKTTEVPYGEVPVYDGTEPARPRQNEAVDYTFTGWEPKPVAVTGEASYTAVYTLAVLEIELTDSTDSKKALAGAEFQLFNDESPNVPVWTGVTDADGYVRLCKVSDEKAQDSLPAYEKGAEFAKNSSYTLKQTKTAEGYIVPAGSWTVKVDDTGTIASPLIRNAAWDDYTTMPRNSVEKYGIRFGLQNVKTATLTYRYNMPVGEAAGDKTVTLKDLSYNLEYTINVEDPVAEGYEFVGWLDENNNAVKHGDKIVLNTVNTKDHVLDGCWRAPLKVAAKTYNGGHMESAAAVEGSDGVFETAEMYRNYTDLSTFCKDYGNQKTAVKNLNEGDTYEFVQARLGDTVIAALRYNVTDHKWQYQKQYEKDWTDWTVGDELILYYAKNKVQVAWVRMDDETGALSALDEALPNKALQIDSVSGITEKDLFDLIGTNAREAVVEKDCYFRFFGLGRNLADNVSDLIVKDLNALTVKNTVNGFVCDQTNGDVTGLETIYLVYSPDPPENSAYLDMENYSALNYAIDDITVNSTDLLSDYRAIQINRDEEGKVGSLSIYDGGSGAKHAGKTLAGKGQKIELVLLDAAQGGYIINGSFEDTDSRDNAYELDVAIASSDSNTVTHTLLYKAYKQPTGDVDNQLLNTGAVTEGTLDPMSGKVTVAFDDDLAPFTFEKKWSVDAYPEALTVNFDIFEIPGSTESNLPAVFNKNEKNDADHLRNEGVTVWQYAADKTYTNQKNGWLYQSQNLPKRNLYYAVETTIMNGSEPDSRFNAVYELSAQEDGGWKQTVTNNRIDNICRVGEQEFKTIQRAVDYIVSNQMTTGAVIEMLCDYIMSETYVDPVTNESENAIVTIPEGYDITLTTKEESDTPYTVFRSYNGESMFTVNGQLTIENLNLSAIEISKDVFYQADDKGGFVNVSEKAVLTVQDGTRMTNGRAENGSAIYVQDGGKAVFTGGTITGNRSTGEELSVGGAVAVGGKNARIELSGDVVINNNYPKSGNAQHNIYLDQDSNEVIRVTGSLGDAANVGVYIPDDEKMYEMHGQPSKPFAVYVPDSGGNAPTNLDHIWNDRYRNAAGRGYVSKVLDHTVVWGPTFDLVADIHWLNEEYQPLNAIPEGAQVKISLNPDNGKGYSTEDQKNITVRVEGDAMKYTFRGLAVYKTNGSLCEYYVKQEQLVAPAEGYKQIKFIGDVGVKKLDPNDQDPKNVNIPLKYNAAMAEAGKAHMVNLYEHRDKASFTITKIAKGLEENQSVTSTFTLYGVKKGLGMGGASDLPMSLRLTDTPPVWSDVWKYTDEQKVTLPVTSAFFQVGGGNQWYCQTVESTLTGKQMKQGIEGNTGSNGLIKFHTFYSFEREQFTVSGDGMFVLNSGEWMAGDVIEYNGDYKVYTGSSWYDLTPGASDAVIRYTRQDGNGGALNRDGGIQLPYDIRLDGYGEEQEPVQITADNSEPGSLTLDELSSEYYWYAVETAVQEKGGQNRSLSSFEWLVAAYDPQYVYDQAGQTLTVTNTLQNGLATYKKWPSNLKGGTATFEVYRLDGVSEPFEDTDLKALIDRAYGTEALTLVKTFTLPEKNGSYVHVEEGIDVGDGKVYFVKETEANGMTPLRADIKSSSGEEADCKYWPYERLNRDNGKLAMYKIENQNEILCKVVDPDGTEHPFRSLNAAYKYGKEQDELFAGEFTIEMLKDYTVPASDCLTIESGRKVTLTTATEGITRGKLVYSGRDGKTRATLTRLEGNQRSLIRVEGNAGDPAATGLTLNNIEFTYSGEKSISYKIGNTTYYNGAYVYAANATVALNSVDQTEATGVEMTGGLASNGGAVYTENGSLSIEWAKFERCKSTDNSNNEKGGGAILVNNGKLTVTNSEFTNCTAIRNGGAVSVVNASAEDVSCISDCTFNACTSRNIAGAIYSSGITLQVENSAFKDCETDYWGGAIGHNKNTQNASTNVQGCVFTNCRELVGNGNDDGGGAINTKAGELHIKDSTFEDCFAYSRGGAIQHFLNNGQANTLLTEVVNSKFYRCQSQNSGGGAMCVAGLTVRVEKSCFEECRANNSAGGAVDIAAHGKGKIGEVSGSVFKGCYAYTNGGAISMASGELAVNDCEFQSCEARQYGGGVSMEPGASDGTPYKRIDFKGSRFNDCKAGTSGGAVYSKSVVLTVGDYENASGETVSSSFTGCQVTNNHGGAIYQEYQNGQDATSGLTPTTSIFGALFENCQAKQSGGAVRTNAIEVTVKDSSFIGFKIPAGDNSNSQSGGAIYASNATTDSVTTLQGTVFENCFVTAHGGAVYTFSKTLNVEDYSDTENNTVHCSFINDKAAGNGGAIYTASKHVTVKGASFKGCEAAVSGGGFYHYLGNTSDIVLTVEDSTFETCKVDNKAANNDPRGGGIYTNADFVGIVNSVFTDCTGEATNNRFSQGGGLYVTNNNLGTITQLIGTTFTRCNVSGAISGNSQGGSVYTNSRTMEILDGTDAAGNTIHCAFTDSASKGHGGGIHHSTATGVRTQLNISGATFERCQSVYSGGGIYTNARNVVVENSTLKHCRFEVQKGDGNSCGGGLRVDYGGENSSTTLRGVHMEDCKAVTIENNQGRGGGAYIASRILTVEDYQDAEENVTHSSFIDCHATYSGGAIQKGNTTLSAATVIGAAFEDCDALCYGGAIQSEAIKTTIKDSSFKRCKVECNINTEISGGAVRVTNNNANTETIIKNSSFEDCYASTIGFANSYGGTIYVSTKNLIAGDGTTIKNSHTQNNGGGIYHYNSSADSVTTLDGLILENCYSSASRGGGVFTWAMQVTVKDTQVKDCYANNWGGGISHDKGDAVVTVTDSSFENCYTLANNEAGGGGMRTNAVKLDIKGTNFTGCYTEAFHGGALYHGYNDNAETVIEDSSFQDCYCAQNMNGGAIYHFAKKLSLVDTAIDGGEIEVNANKGGGIFSERAELTLTGCVIQNCAAFNSGGGIYQNNNNINRDVILDNTEILNNSAANNSTDKSGNKDKNNGGGVYFRPDNSASTLTLRNGVVVSGNRLTYVNSSVDVAAGIYLYQNWLYNSGTLVVGTEGAETADTITVWDNTAMDGAQSNVRLNSANPYDGKVWMRYNNRSSSVRLYSDLKNSRIGVVNPGVPNSQFGISMPNNHSGVGGFVADDMSMTGKINPNNTDQIIWYKPPVCKITDNNGNVLSYISGETTKIAVYNSLAEAIRDFNAGNTSEGHFYDGVNGHKEVPVEPMQIQMLTPAYTMAGVDADLPAFTRNVTLTTAAEGDTDEYYYPSGSPDAVIHRGNDEGSLFSAEGNITVTVIHLTLDGGDADITANGGLINARGAKVVLGQDAVLQNGKTSLNGGAVYLSDGATLDMTKNAAIQNCQASSGGAVYINSGSEMVMTERSTIAGCSASVKGGAVYVAGGGSVDLDGTVARLSIKDNHVSEKNGGAGIYLAANTSSVILNGMLDFDGNTVTTPNASGTENGAENYAYARQDLYLAANTKNDVGSITIAGNLTNGHGDDGFIWVWAENENHYKKDDQFANIQSGVTVQSFTLNAFRDAQDDATIGNKTEQYYTGVADTKNADRVLWGVDIVDVTFLKTDVSGRGLSGAVFTVYPNTGSDNQEKDLKTPLRYRGGADVAPESDEEGRVAIQNVLRRGRTYYMKETTMPAVDANGEKANFGINDSLYLITIHSNDEVAIQVQNGTSWTHVSKLKDSYQIVNEPVICKVVDTDNTEHAFGTLNAAVDYIRKNRSKAYHSGIATIQMLVDYTMPSSDRVTLTTGDVITLTTAHTAKTKTGNEHYLYLGDNGETSIIRRGTGYSNFSMIEAGGSGSLKLENITLDGKLNNRVQQTNADGGFVSLSGNASLTVGEQATLQNTRTSENGGAVYAAAGTRVTVSGGTFTDCTASGNGGAICALTDSVILGEKNKISTITDCSAQNGGSVYMKGNAGTLKLTDITISNSKASAAGGAVYLESSANAEVTVTLINSKVGTPDQANEAGQKGGCLYTKADKLRIELDKDSLIGYSKTTSSSASHGGGAIAHEYRNYNSSTFTLTGVKDHTGKMQSGTVISSTSAASGGGLDISAYRVTINGVTIQKCDSEGSGENGGGGVYLRELSVLEMTDCTIDACNSATMGGGVLIKSASTNTNDHSLISGTTFTACTAIKSGGKGGGVYVKNAMLDVEGCTFGVQTTDNNTRNNKRCQANAYGGAICAENATLDIDSAEAKEHTFFYGDNAGSGGGICTLSNSTVKVYGASFEYCSGNGGGMYLENTDSTVTGCRFISCSGSNNGGGIRVKGTMNDRGLTIQDMEYKDGSGATSYISTEFRGCTGNNGVATGSALYIEDTAVVNVTGHTRITMKLSEEDNNPATVRGCAVYVAGGGLLNFGCSDTDAPSITDYCLSNTGENGAGIYLGFSAWNKYGKLNLQGNPFFSNNISGASHSGTFGGAAYKDKVEQDIYVNMSGYDNVNKNLSKLEAITVKGNLNSPNGIYVFVTDDKNRSKGETDQKHFKLGDQFGITVSTGISDETLALFKNARLDEDTGNTDPSVLVGVRGKEENQVYWGTQNGTDVSFMKVDYQNVPLDGAVFKLYMDEECKTAYTKNEETVKAVSADGKDDKDSHGTVLEKGTVLFEKLPSDVYYLKEEKAPKGSLLNESVFIVLAGKQRLEAPADGAKAGTLWDTGKVLETITQEDIEAQRGKKKDGTFERDYAIFRIENGQAVVSADVAENGIMNYSASLRKVVLRKISDTYESLNGAKFEICRKDGTLVSIKDEKGQELSSFISGVNGVYFIGELSYGTYYLHETDVPGSMKQNEGEGWWYYLIVDESGIYVSGNDAAHKGGYPSKKDAEEAAEENYKTIKQ